MRNVTITRETMWPPLRLPVQRVTDLQGEAAVGDRNPLMALVAQVKLLAQGQHFTLAQKLLQLLDSEYAMERIDQGSFGRLFPASVYAHAPDLAASWLTRRYAANYEIVIDVTPAGLPRDVAIMRVAGNAVSLQLSHELFEFYAGDMILSRLGLTFALIDAFMKSKHRTDGAVAINLLDSGSWPGLAFCECHPGYYLIPDPHYLGHDQYSRSRAEFRQHHVAWAERAPVAYWRGSTTGMPTDPALGWRSLPRVRLCEVAAANPEIIDAGITGVSQIFDPAARADLGARNLLRERVESWSYQQYRYQIDIDGNTNAWDGLVLRLLTGSPVLKVASPFGYEQWYYHRLKPWVNFVPVQTDMADLVEKVNWLRGNDEAAQRIGEAGRALAESLDEREIHLAAPVIAAAIRAEAGAPLIDLRFGERAPDNAVLGAGWRTPGPDGVTVASAQSHLTLATPPGFGDHVLLAELSVRTGLPHQMTMTVNGETLLSRLIAERATVFCLLPRSVTNANDRLDVAFDFRDASGPRPDNVPVVTLHRIGVAALTRKVWAGYSDPASMLADLNAIGPPSLVHDLGWQTANRKPLSLPLDAVLHAVYTCFGTVLYADRASGRVRHGFAAQAPANLFLLQINGASVLAHLQDDGGYAAVRIRPEGPQAPGDSWIPWFGGGAARGFTMVSAGNEAQRRFALQAAGLFACAEATGEFTLSRTSPAEWETFHFAQDAIGA
jgi:hypothetical protein